MIANAVATDEVVWTGSRDAWRQLDKGGMSPTYIMNSLMVLGPSIN